MERVRKDAKAKKRKDSLKIRFYFLLSAALLLIVISIIGPYIAPNNPYAINVTMARKAPSLHYLFGTDRLGRCVFSRVLVGARTTIFSSIILLVILFAIGTAIGVAAGFFGGIFDVIIMRLIDVFQAFPQMVLAIAVAGILGGNLINAMIALGISSWGTFAKLARSQVIRLMEEEYIYAAKISGNSDFNILIRYIFPNCVGVLLVNATMQLSSIMMGIASLSFLGLGIQAPQAEWGAMISESRGVIQFMPWAVWFPSLAMIITILVFNYLGVTWNEFILERKL